jgi:hypothetical protein
MEKYDEKGNVFCQICGRAFVKIPPFHLALHSMSTKQYKETYPGFPFIGKNYMYKKPKKIDPIVTAEELLNITEVPDIKVDSISLGREDIIEDKEIEHIPKVPKIEEIKDIKDITEVKLESKSVKERDFLPDGKYEIFIFLKGFFPSLQNNYFIEKIDLEKHLVYRCITDITDTKKKLVFEFPNAMWHNSDPQSDATKKTTLKSDGWKIIKVPSRNPSVQDVIETLKSYSLF